MSLFTNFAPMVKAGVVVHLTLRQVGDNMQLEILPVSDAGKTGLSIPPRAFLATPAELDEQLPAVIQDYVASGVRLSDQIEVTKVVMSEAERIAKDTAASKAKSTPPKPATKQSAGPSSGKPRDMNAGMLDEEDDQAGGGGAVVETTPPAGAQTDAAGGTPPAAESEPNLFTL